MRKLDYKEIYQLKHYLGLSFSDAESVMNLLYDFKSWNKKYHSISLVKDNIELKNIDDYYNAYMQSNCYVFNTIEDLIKDEEERGNWDCPKEDIHKNTVEFILDSIDNTVFKLDNGHYIQFYI